MPKGKEAKKKQEPVEEQEEVHAEEKEEVKEKPADVLKRACGCCKVKLDELPPHQQYFEAPDGHIIVGEIRTSQTWDRRGKGSWINPRR